MFVYARKAVFGFAAAAVFLTAGCDMSTPSQYSINRIQLKETVKTATLDAFNIDAGRIGDIADDYLRNGKGSMDITVSYRAGDPLKEVEIGRQGRMYRDAFARRGISDVKVNYVPMVDADYVGQVVVSYPAIVALPPKGCGHIPGYQGADDLTAMEKYQIGCDTQSALSKMIVRPEDLKGNAGVPAGDSRRQGAVVEKYKSGEQNQPLNGLDASGIGTNGG